MASADQWTYSLYEELGPWSHGCQGARTAGMGDQNAGNVEELAILGETADRDIPRRTLQKEVD